MKPYLFFDLDGTLCNSAEGILNAVTYAQDKLGLPRQERSEMMHYIGPPLVRTFAADYGLDAEEAERAVAAYREYYNVRGIFECALYDGIPAMLDALRGDGYGLVLATCKPTVSARRVLEHFEIADRFHMVSGPEFDGTRNEKHEVIAYAMEQLGLRDPSGILMIGDRRDDVLGAARNGVDCAGVLWGFGSRAELLDAGAKYLFASCEELVEGVRERPWRERETS